MVIQSSHEVEVVCWFLERAWLCSSRFVSVLLAFPEDVGRIWVSGPAMQHSFASSRNNEIRQGSFPTNLQTLKSHLRLGWTSPLSTVLSWFYDGPLHPTCRCTEAHVPLRGTNVHEEFLSSSSANFGITVLGVVSDLRPCNKVVERPVFAGVVCQCRCAG